MLGRGGFSQGAVVVSIDPASDGSPREVVYAITPPGGRWDRADNGSYRVVLNRGTVRDTAGHTVPGRTLGVFRVLIR